MISERLVRTVAVSLWKKGKLTESEAAEEAGVSLDEFQKAVLLMT